jgi:hypothetical protein
MSESLIGIRAPSRTISAKAYHGKRAGSQARFLEGHRARAKLIACRFPRVLKEGEHGGEMGTMIATLLRDLIGEARA